MIPISSSLQYLRRLLLRASHSTKTMATSLISSASTVPKLPHNYSQSSSHSSVSISSRAQCFLRTKPPQSLHYTRPRAMMVKAGFDISLFERGIPDNEDGDFSLFGRNGLDDDDDGTLPNIPGSGFLSGFPPIKDKEDPPCPPGLRKYRTLVALRPDMSEEERLAFTQEYEELLVAGGAMYVDVFNRGVIPLAYEIRKKNRKGETNIYLDGIYLLFTYFTKPESMGILTETLQADFNVIRSGSFKHKKRRVY